MLQAGIPIVFICDDAYVMPTSVAITSLIENKRPLTVYDITVIGTDLSRESSEKLLSMQGETVKITILDASTDHFAGMHQDQAGSICVASEAALLKFEIPYLLAEYDRVLYLDGDMIVREDMSELFDSDIGENLAGVVSDSGQIYFKHAFVKQTENYFNSGVMILNLRLMRELDTTKTLIAKKTELRDSSLMDQNVFNVVLDGKVRYLPIRYNFLYINLLRAAGKYTIDDVNDLFGTEYTSLDDIERDAAIVHFSSKDKPWKYANVPLADEWYDYYMRSPFGNHELAQTNLPPKVSVVIPVYNVEPYLGECLESVLGQTLTDIEVICVDDGSTDRSPAILDAYRKRDSRITVLSQSNAGQSAARNSGIEIVRGHYTYFMDSDDKIEPDALESLYTEAVQNDLDIVFFDGDTFFETDALARRHSSYGDYYLSTGEYNGVYCGPDLFAELVPHGDYRPSPCLQFILTAYVKSVGLTFYDGIIHEDNLFSLLCILQANRVKHLKKVYFHRRIRNDSTMTSQPTLKNFTGYFVCMSEMFEFVHGRPLSEGAVDAAYRQIAGMYRRAAEVLARLPHSERVKIEWQMGSTGDLFYRFMHSQDVVVRESNKRLSAAEEKLRVIRASRSFRIGKALTSVPRKLSARFRRPSK